MATYNGQKYIKEQIDSILPQLSENDELVISDDQSTDGTTEIIASYKDPRIRFFVNNKTHGVAHNFENALAHAKGDIIFLSDQDDVWVEGKVEKMTSYMKQNHYDVVMCNCMLVDENMKPLTGKPHFNKVRPIKKPVFLNILKNSWLGCCMVFSKKLLTESQCGGARLVDSPLRAASLSVRIYAKGSVTPLSPPFRDRLFRREAEHQ